MRTSFKFFFFFLLVAPFLGSGCGQSDQRDTDLYKTWELTGFGHLTNDALNEMASLNKDDRFLITFSKNGRFVAKTEMTSFSGEYQVTGNSISVIDHDTNGSLQETEIPVYLNNLDDQLEYKIINSRLVVFSSDHEVLMFKPVSQTGTKAGVVGLIAIMLILFWVSAILSNQEKDFPQPVKVR